jgi:hypothetical protein
MHIFNDGAIRRRKIFGKQGDDFQHRELSDEERKPKDAKKIVWAYAEREIKHKKTHAICTTKQRIWKEICSVENLCEHACPTLNHRAENSRVYAAVYL